MENTQYPFINTPLPYAYDALEPYIDEKTMHLHHDRHLMTYIENLNSILEKTPALQRLSLEQLLRGLPRLPLALQTQIRNNAGGVYNHRFYFEGLGRPSAPSEELEALLTHSFGSMTDFQAHLKTVALSVFGSGYAWLVRVHGRLAIITTPNQNTPIERGMTPLLNIDVWEHAYYLKHYNLRADYFDDWWQVINWDVILQRYTL